MQLQGVRWSTLIASVAVTVFERFPFRLELTRLPSIGRVAHQAAVERASVRKALTSSRRGRPDPSGRSRSVAAIVGRITLKRELA